MNNIGLIQELIIRLNGRFFMLIEFRLLYVFLLLFIAVIFFFSSVYATLPSHHRLL